MEIRLARSEDAVSIHQLITELAAFQDSGVRVSATVEDVCKVIDGESGPVECLIATSNERAIGFALFFGSYSTWEGRRGLFLEDLYVVPEARSRGIGQQLIGALCQIARERGCSRVEWMVQSFNKSAMRFYSRLGAQDMPQWIKWRLDEDSIETLANKCELSTRDEPDCRLALSISRDCA